MKVSYHTLKKENVADFLILTVTDRETGIIDEKTSAHLHDELRQNEKDYQRSKKEQICKNENLRSRRWITNIFHNKFVTSLRFKLQVTAQASGA